MICSITLVFVVPKIEGPGPPLAPHFPTPLCSSITALDEKNKVKNEGDLKLYIQGRKVQMQFKMNHFTSHKLAP